MTETVGISELRQNLSRYLRRVERGERLLITDRNRPVAELGPPATRGADLDRLIAEGRMSLPRRRGMRLFERGLPEAAAALAEPALRTLDAIHVCRCRRSLSDGCLCELRRPPGGRRSTRESADGPTRSLRPGATWSPRPYRRSFGPR